MYPYNPFKGQKIQNHAGVGVDHEFLAHYPIPKPSAVDADGIVDGAEATTGAEAEPLVITTFLAQPDVARNITVTVAATTAGDVAAGNIVVAGTDLSGAAISENFAITADTPATVTGSLAFKSVTSITVPVQDGASVTVDAGWGKKFGLPYKLPANSLILLKLFDGSTDSGTVTVSTSRLAANVLAINGTPDGEKNIDLHIITPLI